MTITETSDGSITIVALCGTIDSSTAPELHKSPAIADTLRSVVIDLEKVDFLDSSGLGALVGTLRLKQEAKAAVLLSCMNPRVRKVFDITGTVKLFHIFDDTSAAVEYAATHNEG
ncbi:MAG: STAS domain-containing protein [Chlorobium sp.]|uniref:STAS domain-containing protein n=1 Tax=Chlorobium sp. TaxID=1095 RepID=UPI0025B8EE85|nr:STAS domain-containing protein [Chlorobium sp.]MCF8383064.1 STAS domain-containing protein [Chlorobium sp.]